ncbi:MAG: serine/threonine-protein kinase, partial [Deltaproteobacteria bacterium]
MNATPQPGDRIGHYVLERELGRGAMGTVFLAHHAVLGRKAAVKFLLDELIADQTIASRFIQEAQIVNAIQHPNIVDVFEFHYSEHPRRLAYVMEYLGAQPLHLVARHLSVVQALTIARQIASALCAVHAAGVVHRDLKPDNILVEMTPRFGAGPVAKLADFGIAKVRGPGRPTTEGGRVVGTPAYMAPEQVAAQDVDGRADLYAFGAILYELFTGRRLFGDDAARVMHAKVRGTCPPLDALDATAGGGLIRPLVEQCLAFEPTARPTAQQVMDTLDAWLSDTSVEMAASLTRLGTPTPWNLRSPSSAFSVPALGGARAKGWAVGGVLGVALLVGLVIVQKTYAFVNAPEVIALPAPAVAVASEGAAGRLVLEAQVVPPVPERGEVARAARGGASVGESARGAEA